MECQTSRLLIVGVSVYFFAGYHQYWKNISTERLNRKRKIKNKYQGCSTEINGVLFKHQKVRALLQCPSFVSLVILISICEDYYS